MDQTILDRFYFAIDTIHRLTIVNRTRWKYTRRPFLFSLSIYHLFHRECIEMQHFAESSSYNSINFSRRNYSYDVS